jgi:phosphohistidine phosphatase
MKRCLLLMRHAKAAPVSLGIMDHERPLLKEGLDNAREVGKKLHKHGYEPDVVLCSDAKRTLETWQQVKASLGPNAEFTKSSKLYESGMSAYKAVLSAEGEGGKCVLIIGHNPSIEELVAALTNERVEVKPSDTVVLQIKAPSWDAAFDRSGEWQLAEIVKC